MTRTHTRKQKQEPKTVGISVRLPIALRDKIAALAVSERRTVANMIRNLLEDAVQARELID